MDNRVAKRMTNPRLPRLLCILLAAIYIALPSPQAYADTVYLKDGRILRDCRATRNGTTWAIEKGGATISLPAASVQKVDKSEIGSAEAAGEDKAAAAAQAVPSPLPTQTPTAKAMPRPTLPSPTPTATAKATNDEFPLDPKTGYRDYSSLKRKIDQEFIDSWDFNLEREIARVMLDPRVPDVNNPNWEHFAKWQRSSYQDVIDAARTAFHKHRNPKTGAPGKTLETITVPGNITGKDTLRVRYVSGNLRGKNCWGDDEDIVYLTGQTANNSTLKILPGTIVLAASFQNDQGGGVMSPSNIQSLKRMWVPNGGHEENHPLQRKFQYTKNEYTECMTNFINPGTLLAIGKESSPILLVSDSQNPTPFDFLRFRFKNGVIDYFIDEDHSVSDAVSLNTLSARSKFHYHLESGRNGPGWVIANYFGNTYNENIDIHLGNETFFIYYNLFANNFSGGITVARVDSAEIKNNSFENLGPGSIIFIKELDQQNIVNIICENNSFGKNSTFWNGSSKNITLKTNYWGTTNPSVIEKKIRDKKDNIKYGLITFRPYLTSPDTDRDGLTDEEERRLGTNPRIMDTDQDGVIDGRDDAPLDPDTDGNGVPDGIDWFRSDYLKLVPTLRDFEQN